MKLKIRNFRGAKSAEIELAPIALVAGRNAAGKTSVAQAAQALLTGEVVPVKDLTKRDASSLIHAGTGSGAISLETENGSCRIEYPKAKKVTDENPPSASKIAAGMVSFPGMDPKTRAALLHDYLKCGPSREDIEKVAQPLGLSEEYIDKMWAMINSQGWDAAHKSARDYGIEHKGQWRGTTGEIWGSAKAGKWIPHGWESDLDGASKESLTALVTEARESRDAAIGHDAVSQDQIGQLQLSAGKVQERRIQVESFTEEAAAANGEQRKTGEILTGTPSPDKEIKTTACPFCGEGCVILGGDIIKPPPALSLEENTKIRLAGEEAAKNYTNASLKAKQLTEKLHGAKADLQRSEKAVTELAAMEERGGDGADADSLERTRRELLHAEERMMAFEQKTRADQTHASIVRNQEIMDILAPEGLRAVKMKGAISVFNQRLKGLADCAGWDTVEITDGLSILYRGMAWGLCSESEQFRGRVMIQVALAEIDGSDALIIDGADTLVDRKLRSGLLRLLSDGAKIPALFCMALPDRESMPDLEAAGFGISYWIEKGVVE